MHQNSDREIIQDCGSAVAAVGDVNGSIDLPEEQLEDKIRGGMLGQILGNLNGFRYEGLYIHEPGQVDGYVPSLPDGAWAEDDTDIEWVYVTAMDRLQKTYLAPEEITELWHKHINRRIWVSNLYARQLMDIGLAPPLTGRIALNPWAEHNVSGHFVAETFGLVAPALPRTASRIGLHYTHVTIDGEPAQSTQLFVSMIAVAFVESDFEKILVAGLAAVDPASEVFRIGEQVRRIWQEHPLDWRAGRQRIKELYQIRADGDVRDWAGTELNTAAMVGAFLYGKGDFVETLRLAFNFGWDADGNAATLGTIVGVMKGRRWMDSQGWTIKDIYRNRFPEELKWDMVGARFAHWSNEVVRDQMPEDETITSYTNKIITVAKRVLAEQGAKTITRKGKQIYRIGPEASANVEPLPRPLDRLEELRRELVPKIEQWLGGTEKERARAAYAAFCLQESERLEKEWPSEWHRAIEALRQYPQLLQEVYPHFRWPVRDRIMAALSKNKPASAH